MAMHKKVITALILIFVSLSIIGLILGGTLFLAYRSIPSIDNINSCFKTSMYNVDLCPTKSSYIKYRQLPRHLVYSLIAAEDASFYDHQGFDLEGIQDSLEKSLDAGRWVRGGSTITQQLAKNLYLSPERTLVRKAKELILAKKIEKTLSKDKIIEKYFNVVEFGPKIFGISKASRHYFDKHPSELSPAEGAYLVSLLPSPVKYSGTFRRAKDLSNFNKRRVTHILRILHLQKKISDDDYSYEVARTESGLWNPPPVEETEELSFFQNLFSSEEPSAEAAKDSTPNTSTETQNQDPDTEPTSSSAEDSL